MKGVAIAAIVTSTIMPLFRISNKSLANPGMFIIVMVLVLLIQAPILFLPNFIDWLLGNKPNDTDAKSRD